MLVEIRKAGFKNKGAELMLRAILEKMRQRYPDAQFVMAPSLGTDTPYLERAALGLHQKAWLWRYGIQWGDTLGLMPQRLRDMYGIVLDRDIDVVIDAAGFAYSDQWGVASTRELAHCVRRWRKQGTTVILMPQALGPFESPAIRKLVAHTIPDVDLVFARDQVSHDHLTDVVGPLPNIRMAPDFTNLIEGAFGGRSSSRHGQVAMVPNARMLDKTPTEVGRGYVQFMSKVAAALLERGLEPFFLIHEGEADSKLAANVIAQLGTDIPIVSEADPIKIKEILGSCHATVSCRFHALVSALAQGVPSLACGWSHKYPQLLQDYDCADRLLDVGATMDEIRDQVEWIADGQKRTELGARIRGHATELRHRSEQMWQEVFACIERARGLSIH